MRYSYKTAIVTLTDWAKAHGFNKIVFDWHASSEIDWHKKNVSVLNIPKHIKIQSQFTYEYQTYLFLHELGHHRLRKDWVEYAHKLPSLSKAEEIELKKGIKKYQRRTSYFVESLEEEFMAWSSGLDLATELGLKINMERWIAFKTKCLMSYIRHFANK